jgi:flagellar protein FlaG
MDINSVPAIVTGPRGLDALAATAAPPPAEPVPQALDPPVKLDIGTGGVRYVRNQDTGTMVFQVVDPSSGDVIEQLPSETALRNRAYDSAHGHGASAPATLSRVA